MNTDVDLYVNMDVNLIVAVHTISQAEREAKTLGHKHLRRAEERDLINEYRTEVTVEVNFLSFK